MLEEGGGIFGDEKSSFDEIRRMEDSMFSKQSLGLFEQKEKHTLENGGKHQPSVQMVDNGHTQDKMLQDLEKEENMLDSLGESRAPSVMPPN